jgi:hypothetical protein
LNYFSSIIKHHQASSNINNVSKTPNSKTKPHFWGGCDRLYTLQQQDLARIPRLESQEPTILRTNLPATLEMYLWVSERNVAQKDAPTRQNSRH